MDDITGVTHMLNTLALLGSAVETNGNYQMGLQAAIEQSGTDITQLKVCDLLIIMSTYKTAYNEMHAVYNQIHAVAAGNPENEF